MKIPMLTNAMIMVANAFILGLTPRRTLEKTLIGKVVEPGPETKLAITKSSNDNVKPKSHEAVSAGKMMSRVIKKILSEEERLNPLPLLHMSGPFPSNGMKE